MLSKGYLYHLFKVNDLEHEVPSIDSVSILNKFQDVSWSQGDLLVARYEAICFYVVEECPNCQQVKVEDDMRSHYPHLFSS